jgi:hypothetical protein
MLTLAVFTAAILVSHAVSTWEWLAVVPRPLGWLVQPLLAVALVAGGLAWMHRQGAAWLVAELGLARPFVAPCLFALMASLPLAIGFGLGDDPLANLDWLSLLFTLAVWPLVEEIVFRGYAFRQLHRRAGWGFFAAALVPPLIFAVTHVVVLFFRDADLRLPLLAAGASLLGGLFFSWLFVAWGDNLWAPAAFHGVMNFWWEGFGIDRTGIGTWGGNLLRLSAVVLAVVLTVGWQRLFSRTPGPASEPATPVPRVP